MNKDMSRYSMGLLVGLVVLVGGCFNLQKPSPEKRSFMLTAKTPATKAFQAEAILKVQNVGVSPPYAGKSFVYTRGQGGFESDFYNGFFVAPGAMFSELVRQWMGASGLFRHVVESSSYMEATHILEGTVTALYGDYSMGQSPRAVLEMDFLLLNNTGTVPTVVSDKSYRLEVPVQGKLPRELVKGWNEAFDGIMKAFEADIGEVLGKV